MKNWIVALFAVSALASCQSSTTKDPAKTAKLIVGTWIGTQFDFTETSDGDHSEMISRNMSMHENSILQLLPNGSYEVSDAFRTTVSNGDYWVDDDTLYINAYGDTSTYYISSIGENELVVQQHIHSTVRNEVLDADVQLYYQRAMDESAH